MAYALTSVAFVLALLLCAYLIGLGAFARLGLLRPETSGLSLHLLAIATGIGCASVLLFILAAGGALTRPFIAGSFVAAALLAAYSLKAAGVGRKALAMPRCAPGSGLFCTGVAITALAGFLLAMAAPYEWDELAYHLPYARDYAVAGGLVVSDYQRFPLNPHNYQLLYAAALLFSSEAATHLLHAFSTGLVAAGIVVFGRRYFSLAAGVLAAFMFLATAGYLLDTAYVDLGVAMFVFFAFFAFALWQRHGDEGFLLVAAFLAAMAMGTKYQALSQLPGFTLALLLAMWLRAKPAPPAAPFTGRAALWPAARALAVFVVFGCYWYVRNWWVSGDPLHPLGADVFGYWLWDAGDLAGQREDVARFRHHIPIELVPALAFVFLPGKRKPEELSLLVIALAGLATWYLTSRYDRYFLATYPLMAILSAQVMLATAGRLLPARVLGALRSAGGGSGLKALRILGFALFASVMIRSVANGWDTVCFTWTCVDRVHAQRLASFAASRQLPGFWQLRLYQYGLENERYYLGERVPGDFFGPYRYRTILESRGSAAVAKQELQRMGLDSILVNQKRWPFNELGASGSLAPEFDTLYRDENVAIYRIADD